MSIMIGGHFLYIDGEIKGESQNGQMLTWNNTNVDVKYLYGGYGETTKEKSLQSPDDTTSKVLRFIVEMSPGDITTCKIEVADSATKKTFPIGEGCIEKVHIKFVPPLCGKNTWEKYRKGEI